MPVQRRRFSEEFKLRVIQEVLSGERQASVARRHSVSANTILQWLKSCKTGRLGGGATGASSAEVRPLRGFIITTDSRHRFPVYLAVILDAFARRVIGWALSRSLEATLVIDALAMALKARKPPPGLMHHSDRGVQYASHAYTDILKQHGVRISMSRKGNPYDNAVAESFFKTLKKEVVYLSEYRTPEEAQRQIGHFIEQVYNQKRLHSSLGYLPPVEYELQYKQHAPAA